MITDLKGLKELAQRMVQAAKEVGACPDMSAEIHLQDRIGAFMVDLRDTFSSLVARATTAEVEKERDEALARVERGTVQTTPEVLAKLEGALTKVKARIRYGDSMPGYEDPMYLELDGLEEAKRALVPVRERLLVLEEALALAHVAAQAVTRPATCLRCGETCQDCMCLVAE